MTKQKFQSIQTRIIHTNSAWGKHKCHLFFSSFLPFPKFSTRGIFNLFKQNAHACISACVLSCFICVQLFATLWTVAFQAPLSMILQARILAWVAMHNIIILRCSVAKSCLSLCHPMHYSTWGFLVLHYLLKFAQIHAIQSWMDYPSMWWMLPNHLSNHFIFATRFSFYLQSFPASGSFPMSQFFMSERQSNKIINGKIYY